MANQKTVYSYNEDGYYIGETIAYESPLEPGVFLIPAQATEVEPPAATIGCWPRYLDGQWVLVEIPRG